MIEDTAVLLEALGETLAGSDRTTIALAIPGNDLKTGADFGSPFNHQEAKHTFQTTVAEAIKLGVLNEVAELRAEEFRTLYYTMPNTDIEHKLLVLDAIPDLTGWVKLDVKVVYND